MNIRMCVYFMCSTSRRWNIHDFKGVFLNHNPSLYSLLCLRLIALNQRASRTLRISLVIVFLCLILFPPSCCSLCAEMRCWIPRQEPSICPVGACFTTIIVRALPFHNWTTRQTTWGKRNCWCVLRNASPVRILYGYNSVITARMNSWVRGKYSSSPASINRII
jgi:hypothetical protein